MSESASSSGGPLTSFLERCLVKVEFADLCSEIERLGYVIDYNVHTTKGAAILEIFRQRNINGIQDDIELHDDCEKVETCNEIREEKRLEKKTVSPVKTFTRVLRATGLPIARIAAQFRTTKASILRQKVKYKEPSTIKSIGGISSKEASPKTGTSTLPINSDATIPPSPLVPAPESTPPSVPSTTLKSALKLKSAYSEELGEEDARDEPAESDKKYCDSDAHSNPNISTPKRVHFSPVLHTLLGLEDLQSDCYNTEVGSLVDDKELEEEFKKMADDVYKQIDMWGEALGNSNSDKGDSACIVDEIIRPPSAVRVNRVSNLKKRGKVSSAKMASMITVVPSHTPKSPLLGATPRCSVAAADVPSPSSTLPLHLPDLQKEVALLLQLAVAHEGITVPSDSEKTDSDSVSSTTVSVPSTTAKRISRLKSPSQHGKSYPKR